MTSFSADKQYAPKSLVAQQVMDLFKGALDVEKELASFEEELKDIYNQKSSEILPTQPNGYIINADSTFSSQKAAESRLKVNPQHLEKSSWSPVDTEGNGQAQTDIKASVALIKTETEAVTSFDESLDQFYDVLNDLSD